MVLTVDSFPPGDICQCLEVFLIVATGVCVCVGGGESRDAATHPTNAQDRLPTTKNNPVQSAHSTERPGCEEKGDPDPGSAVQGSTGAHAVPPAGRGLEPVTVLPAAWLPCCHPTPTSDQGSLF